MAERRTTRTARRGKGNDLAEEPEHELAEEPEDELAEEPEDELVADPEDEPAEEEPEDELVDDPEDDLTDEEPVSSDGGGATQRSRRDRGGGMRAAEAGQTALRQIADLTGKQAEGVTGVESADDGWIVGVEVVEDRRIPSSTDILATYETELDMDGELVSYRRVRRYTRGHGDSEA